MHAGRWGADLGVDYSAAKKLIAHAKAHGMGRRVLMLGRNKLQVKDKHRAALDRQLDDAGLGVSFADVEQADGYAEAFFKALGAEEVVSMDLSDYEGAEITHDLNDPVTDDHAGGYDLIYDGGTTEHIFDVARCMDNLNVLLADGGVLASCAPANNWFAHGFYQFGPELVYGYWKHGCGFDVLDCAMLPEMPRDKELALPDPAEAGVRLRVRGKMPNQRVYLWYEVRKGPNAHRWTRALQTDYVRKWSDHDKAQNRESEIVALREAHLAETGTGA